MWFSLASKMGEELRVTGVMFKEEEGSWRSGKGAVKAVGGMKRCVCLNRYVLCEILVANDTKNTDILSLSITSSGISQSD